MADEQFYTMLTNIGKAKVANAALLSSNVTLKTLKVGDGNGAYYNPTEDQKELRNVVYTCNVGSVSVNKDNPNWIVAETIIPGSIGGFTIREIGLFDTEGDMIAIGKYPETYKPVVANGASKDLCIRTIFEVSNTESVNLSINPSVIIATKEDISNLQAQIDEHKKEYTELKEDVEQLSNPSLLINDTFQIWQRGNSFEFLDGDNELAEYTADRWLAWSSTSTWDSGTLTPNNLTKIENYYDEENICRCLKWHTIGNDSLIQFCEDKSFINKNRERGLTFSIKVRGDAGAKLKLCIHDCSTFRNASSITAIATKEIICTGDIDTFFVTSDSHLFSYYPTVSIKNESGIEKDFLLYCVKLELGDKSTPFITRTHSGEWALCRRYYKEYTGVLIPRTYSVNAISASINLENTMRTIPTVSFKNSNFNTESSLWVANGGAVLQTGFTFNLVTEPKLKTVCINANKEAHGLTNTTSTIRISEGNPICCDSEIY